MNTILVTGASGFIGRHCLPLLTSRGYEVHAVCSKLPAQDSAAMRWHQVDLLDSTQVANIVSAARPTHLLHLAWCTAPGAYRTSPENVRWVQASLELLQRFAAQGGQRVVMAGTCAEYSWKHGWCSEAVTPIEPATLYGICKHSLQTILTAFAERRGLSAGWGRLFFVYGPHEHRDRLVPSVICSLLQGRQARCTLGNQVRDFCYVEDVADAFVALLDSPVTGSINVASGRPLIVKDLVYAIADKLNRRELVDLGALPTSLDDPPLLVADVRRLGEEVGWSPRYDLDAGLERTIRWWRAQSAEGARP